MPNEKSSLVAISNFTKEAISRAYNIPHEDIELIYPPIPLGLMDNLNNVKKVNSVISIGRFDSNKDQISQIKIAQKTPDIFFNICGYTPNKQSINYFNELTQFVNNLDPEIKSKIKFRTKGNFGYNSEKKFSEIFGEKTIDKISFKNSFKKTILSSKLIIITYPETSFCEAMYSNIPTILIIKKNHRQFSKTALETFNILKENKIAFEDFNEAKIHINKHWQDIDRWWKNQNVQSARKIFLANFFNVKSDWYREWSDYIYSARL